MNGLFARRSVPILILLLPAIWAGASWGQAGWTWGGIGISKKGAETPQLKRLGKDVYQQACFYCHGPAGKGDGMAARYLATKPRDFTSGLFKVRTTPTGVPPRDEDLFRTITAGFPEYGMPRFAYLSAHERWGLVSYIKNFSKAFEGSPNRQPIELGAAPAQTPELLELGKQLYIDAGCAMCHGNQGRGDGPSAYDLKDTQDRPVVPRDFILGDRAFKGGSSARDITRTLLTGLAGSAMPAYGEVLEMEQAWAIGYYVEALAKGTGP